MNKAGILFKYSREISDSPCGYLFIFLVIVEFLKKTFTFNPELQILTRRKERRIDFSSNTGFLIFIPICLSTKSVKKIFFPSVESFFFNG